MSSNVEESGGAHTGGDIVVFNAKQVSEQGGKGISECSKCAANFNNNDVSSVYGMLAEVDDSVSLDGSAAELIMILVKEGIVERTVDKACLYAKLRESKNVRMSDLQVHTERKFGIRIPGTGNLPTPSGFGANGAASKAHDVRKAYRPLPT